MKIKILRDSIILETTNKIIEAKNIEFMEEELRMTEKLNPDMDSTDTIINFLEIMSNTANDIVEHKFEKEFHQIIINDTELGDLITLDINSATEFDFKMNLLDILWAREMGKGYLYIRTEINKEWMEIIKKKK